MGPGCAERAKLPEPNKGPGWGGAGGVCPAWHPVSGGTIPSPASEDTPHCPGPYRWHHQCGMLSPDLALLPSRPFLHHGDEPPQHRGPGRGPVPPCRCCRGMLQCTRRSLAVHERACGAQPRFIAADGSRAAAQFTSGCGLPGSQGPAGAGPVGAEPSLCSGRFCQGDIHLPSTDRLLEGTTALQSPALKMQSCRSDAAHSAPALNPSGTAGARRALLGAPWLLEPGRPGAPS